MGEKSFIMKGIPRRFTPSDDKKKKTRYGFK